MSERFPIRGTCLVHGSFAGKFCPACSTLATLPGPMRVDAVGVGADGVIPMCCSACGKAKPNDGAWARPVEACECGNRVWAASVVFSNVQPVTPSLREKLEAPGVVREILASSSRLVELLDESEWGLPNEVLDVRDELRRKLALLDEIRTGS